MAANIFAMPSSSMLLLFSFAFSLTTALPWAGAQQTNVYREAAWSPAPTAVPEIPANIFKRAAVDVNVCGWIGGNSGIPAVCSAGSSCVHDTIHAVVGCCTTDGPCTAGVYSSCVDKNSVGWMPNSGMQNNGIYSCSGDDVCYRNTYPGGYYQYGCGASEDATSVETTYSGQASDELLQVVFTGVNFSPVSAAASTTSAAASSSNSAGRSSSSLSSTSSASSSSLSSSSSSFSSSTSSSSSANSSKFSKSSSSTGTTTIAVAGKATGTEKSATSTPTEEPKKVVNKGAIVGACIGGVLGLAAIVGFALWYGRRRRQKKRNEQRAGSFITQHNSGRPPTSGPFQRIVPYSPDDFGGPMMETRGIVTTISAGPATNITGVFPTQYANAYASLPSQSQSPPLSPPPRQHSTQTGSEPGTFHNHYLPSLPTASTPLVSNSEIDDFSRGYNDAQAERDTHIHTGELPIAATGAPMLLRGGSGGSSRARRQDWSITTEALRAQRPRNSSIPTEPAGCSPRGLSMRGRNAEVETRTGDGSPEWNVPPRSPLRDSIRASLSAAVAGREREDRDDGVQRYQLVDEVVGENVPILHTPGQLRPNRARRESLKD